MSLGHHYLHNHHHQNQCFQTGFINENNENLDELNLPKRHRHLHLKDSSPGPCSTPTKLVPPSSALIHQGMGPLNLKNSTEKLRCRLSSPCYEMVSGIHPEDKIDAIFPDRAQSLQNLNASLCPAFDKNTNYFQEFWRMYFQNEIMISRMRDHVEDIKIIRSKVREFEEFLDLVELQKAEINNKNLKKKNRRTSTEIAKEFQCPYSTCLKLYGSEVSLNLHIKLKHNGGNKTEREKLAKTIINAKLKGEILPNVELNFPPGYLENFKSVQKKSSKKLKGKSNSNFDSDSKREILGEATIKTLNESE